MSILQRLTNISLKRALLMTLCLFPGICILLLLVVVLSGAQLLDGLFGIYENNALQDLLIQLYILSIFITPVLAIVVSVIWFAANRKQHKKAWVVPTAPLAIIGSVFFIGAVTSSDLWRSLGRQNTERNSREYDCSRLDVAAAGSQLSPELTAEVWTKSGACRKGSMTKAEVDALVQKVENEIKATKNTTE